jgi:hypothetical protein
LISDSLLLLREGNMIMMMMIIIIMIIIIANQSKAISIFSEMAYLSVKIELRLEIILLAVLVF